MKRFTLRMYAFVVAVLTAFLGTATVAAADYPTLTELYGRYTFNGTMTSYNESQGGTAVEPAAKNGYTMVVVPGTEENTVQILGFFGYGGGLTATYDAETGVLNFNGHVVWICQTNNDGTMVYVMSDFVTPLDWNFNVAVQDGKIVITSTSELTATFAGSDKLTYAAGYTLTKENVNVPAESAAGTYEFVGNEPYETSYSDAWEEFDLTLTPKADGKMGVKGLFDFDDEIEVDYLADGGILLLPFDYTFSNGSYMGTLGEEGGGFRFEPAPYILVENGKLTTPSTFIVNGEFNEEQGYSPSLSFCGGEGIKVDGAGVAEAVAESSNMSVTPLQGGIRVQTAEATQIEVYDVRAVKVAGTVATSADFNGLAAGVYVVKAGGRTVKVVVK